MPSIYINKWDCIIKNWMVTPGVLSPLSEPNLSIDHLPEPYYGDMDDCSIVIVNLNPGAGQCYQQWCNKAKSKTAVNEVYRSSYSSYATPFPLLIPSATFCTPSFRWWQYRKQWMDRILGCLGVATRKMPFAIELCPLHSKRFRISNPIAYVNKVKAFDADLDIVEAIKWAICHSDAQLGLAVGKSIYNVLVDNGFNDVTKGTHFPIPCSCREYHVVDNQGVKVLCTWARGSNTAPASAWRDFESDFIKKNL